MLLLFWNLAVPVLVINWSHKSLNGELGWGPSLCPGMPGKSRSSPHPTMSRKPRTLPPHHTQVHLPLIFSAAGFILTIAGRFLLQTTQFGEGASKLLRGKIRKIFLVFRTMAFASFPALFHGQKRTLLPSCRNGCLDLQDQSTISAAQQRDWAIHRAWKGIPLPGCQNGITSSDSEQCFHKLAEGVNSIWQAVLSSHPQRD